eukprot:3068763-Pyramimonas_sp.AAC.1
MTSASHSVAKAPQPNSRVLLTSCCFASPLKNCTVVMRRFVACAMELQRARTRPCPRQGGRLHELVERRDARVE